MRFTKMHGCGNDYVYLDGFAHPMPRDPAALSRAVSDRHRGVGSDGLILILPSSRADARMRMFNADGSEAEMCGNGIRCVGKYIHDHGIAPKPRVTIETGRGVLTLDLHVKNHKVERVTVDMGKPILRAGDIPTTLAGDPPLETRIEVLNTPVRVTCVSTGNPHAVVFRDDLLDVVNGVDPVARLGAALETHPAFPRRVNVHFVRTDGPNEVTMRTWERGSGLTMACGTGACAVAVAAYLTGRTGRKVLAHLPGGDLELNWPEADGRVWMTGPAVEVFSGDWPDAP